MPLTLTTTFGTKLRILDISIKRGWFRASFASVFAVRRVGVDAKHENLASTNSRRHNYHNVKYIGN